MFIPTHLLTWLTFAPWVARNREAASLPAWAALCMRQFSIEESNDGWISVKVKSQFDLKSTAVQWEHYTTPVGVSGASGLLPLWMSWAAKLFSSNEVPLTTGASSSNGFTEASEDTVIYCRASHRAVLPSWSFSSRSSLNGWTDYMEVPSKRVVRNVQAVAYPVVV